MTAEVAEWQSRPLEPLYPAVFFYAVRVKLRDRGTVCNKAVYLALVITPDGRKPILGLWIDLNEGAKFWLRIVNELRNRGVKDILIAVVDGLKGFPEAIHATFPQTLVQTCIVHLLRNSLAYVSWQDRRQVVAALKPIYHAPTADAALVALSDFEACLWGRKYPSIAPTNPAAPVGSGDPVLRLPARGATDHLHHQCDREPQQHLAHRRSQPRTLSHG